jgi:hypothetical protein
MTATVRRPLYPDLRHRRASSSTARSRRCRQRARDGLVQLTIEVDEIAVGDLLTHHGLLPAGGTDDRDELDAAWREFVARLITADAKQHYG